MKKLEKIIVIVMFVVLFNNTSVPIIANDNDAIENDFLVEFINLVSNSNEEFYDWKNGDIIFNSDLYLFDASEVSAGLYSIYIEGVYDGYLIADIDKRIVYEFSHSSIPYSVVEDDLDSVECLLYEMGNYGILYNGSKICFDESGNIYHAENIGISTLDYIIPGVSPQLQNSNNCIVAALSNVIWFWGNNGYNGLISGLTFEQLKTKIDTKMLNAGGYTNRNVQGVYNAYVIEKSYTPSCDVIWSPTVHDMVNEVANGRPCMLGFAAGSTYSESVGHMTMCYGYQYIAGGTYYSIVADGHTTAKVYKVWNQYNDCVIKMDIQ